MARYRLWVFYGLFAFLVGGHLYDGILDKENWPFSNYPMFRGITPSTLTTPQIVFVTDESVQREVPAQLKWVPSLPLYKFQQSLQTMMSKTYGDPQRLHKEMADYLETYQSRWNKGLTDGPKVKGLRLYKVTFPLELPFKPLDLDHAVPKDAELVVEVDSDRAAGGGK